MGAVSLFFNMPTKPACLSGHKQISYRKDIMTRKRSCQSIYGLFQYVSGTIIFFFNHYFHFSQMTLGSLNAGQELYRK